jgi:hypothetical protein
MPIVGADAYFDGLDAYFDEADAPTSAKPTTGLKSAADIDAWHSFCRNHDNKKLRGEFLCRTHV